MGTIFKNGWWSCGFDMLATANMSSTSIAGIFDQFSGGDFGVGVSAANAVFSGKGAAFSRNSHCGRTFDTALTELMLGIWMSPNLLPISPNIQCFLTLANTGGTVASLGFNNLGQIGVYSAGGVQGSTALSGLIGNLSAQNLIVPAVYVPIELHISATGIEVRVNRTSVLTLSNAFGAVNQLYIGSNTSNFSVLLDHLYVLDMTGAAPFNNYLTKWRIQTDGPIAGSATPGLNAWTPTTPQGSDWANAANIPPNSAQNNYSAIVGARMSLAFPPLNTSRVYGLNSWMSLEEDAAGGRSATPIYRSNNVDQSGDEIALPGSFQYFSQNSVIDPNTGQPWFDGSVAAAQACEIGASVSA